MSFVHLHNHTCYSLLDGADKIPDLLARTKELGMEAIAITDHGVMYGVIEFYKEAKKAGIKPIIGCEIYVAPRSHRDKVAGQDDTPYHLVLLAENQEGYQNLIKLVSIAGVDGFYYKPRVDKELLSKYHKGLIALSACLAGEVPSLLLQGKEQEAEKAALLYREIFGEDNFYLELQDHGMAEQRIVNSKILELHERTGIPLVATNDVHYVSLDNAHTQDVMLCIQTGKTIYDQERLKFETQEFYLKSEEEMRLLFGDYPEALANTVKIAERCNVDFEFGQNHLPVFSVPSGFTVDSYLEKLCREGLAERYIPVTSVEEERLQFELDTIRRMGYSGYFLIVWDFIRFAKSKGIYVGPGRGSAAGSIVAYCLGITEIDPIKYKLLFERFLNPERVSMPDIDIDFCYERRGEVIEYVVEKYGADHVAQIITFGTLAAKAAIRDAGRAMGVPLPLVDKVAKMIPPEIGITLEKALNIAPDLQQLATEDSTVQELLDTAMELEGMPRHVGVHAAGLVISAKPLVEYLPVQRTADGLVCTQFDKDTVEELGLLKMDLLGLRTLTVANNAVKLVEQSQGITIDLSQISLDDPEVYELLSKGDTIGVFQLESSGLRAVLKELKPQTFEDIIAINALYRPGPLGSGMIEDFIKRRHGEVEVTYLHPILEPILKPTYGVIVYQEQVMMIASELAGFSLGEADLLRRAMGKKKPEILAGLRQQFIDGAEKKGVNGETAGKVFDLMEYFAGYGFNKSHSAAYALLAYQTAYLKAKFPVEFMAALMTSVMETADRVPFYVQECRERKIKVLPPDINESSESFLVRKDEIRFGLGAIKQVGVHAIQAILKERENGPFLSLQDFCARVDLNQLNRRVLENLIKAGAFSSIPGNRAQLLQILPQCIEQGLTVQREKNSNQLSLFDFAEKEEAYNPPIPLPEIDDFTERELLQMEKEVLGLYLTGHPLAEYQEVIRRRTSHNIEELTFELDGETVIIAGIITSVRRTVTKRGELMAYIMLEDLTGQLEVLVFPKNFTKFNHLLQNDQVVIARGRFNYQEDKPKLMLDQLEALEDEKLYLKIPVSLDEEQALKAIIPVIKRHRGNTPLYLYFPGSKKLVQCETHYWVHYSAVLQEELEKILGDNSISLVKK